MNYKMSEVLKLIGHRLEKIPKFYRNRVQKELFNELSETRKRLKRVFLDEEVLARIEKKLDLISNEIKKGEKYE